MNRRKGLFIIDLENPYEPPRELHHLTKWEVADVQWNPHQVNDKWVASTVFVLIYNNNYQFHFLNQVRGSRNHKSWISQLTFFFLIY